MISSKQFADTLFDRMEMESNPLTRRGMLEYEVNGHTESFRREIVSLKSRIAKLDAVVAGARKLGYLKILSGEFEQALKALDESETQ